MSTAPPGSLLRLVAVTRDAARQPVDVRLLGVPGARRLPDVTVGRDETAVEAARRGYARLTGDGGRVSDHDVLIAPIRIPGNEFAAILTEPQGSGSTGRYTLAELATLDIDMRDAIKDHDLVAVRVALDADDRRAGRDTAARRAHLLPGYEAISLRNVTHNTLMWQAPGLSVTAQAFLLTLALGDGTQPVPRILAAVIALVLAIASVQLLLKHSHHEIIGSRTLERLELLAGWPLLHVRPPKARSKFVGSESRVLWAGTLWVFAAASVAVIVAVVLRDADMITVFTPAD